MWKNIASLSLLIVVGAVANAFSAPRQMPPAHVVAYAPMTPVEYFDEKFGSAMMEVQP